MHRLHSASPFRRGLQDVDDPPMKRMEINDGGLRLSGPIQGAVSCRGHGDGELCAHPPVYRICLQRLSVCVREVHYFLQGGGYS